MKRRVVVTGLGAVTPIGNTVDEFWTGVRTGKTGIGPITRFDAEGYKAQLAAEVKDFNAREHMDAKAARRMELFSQYAVAAALEAKEDAAIDMEQEDVFRVGVMIGSGVGSLATVELAHEKIVEKGPGRVCPNDDSIDDIQYGSRKCIHSAGCQRKMYECSNSLRIRYTLYRRRFSGNSVWRCGCDICRRYGKRNLSDRSGWILSIDGAQYQYRSYASIDSV